jgi:hypothetical protein
LAGKRCLALSPSALGHLVVALNEPLRHQCRGRGILRKGDKAKAAKSLTLSLANQDDLLDNSKLLEAGLRAAQMLMMAGERLGGEDGIPHAPICVLDRGRCSSTTLHPLTDTEPTVDAHGRPPTKTTLPALDGVTFVYCLGV